MRPILWLAGAMLALMTGCAPGTGGTGTGPQESASGSVAGSQSGSADMPAVTPGAMPLQIPDLRDTTMLSGTVTDASAGAVDGQPLDFSAALLATDDDNGQLVAAPALLPGARLQAWLRPGPSRPQVVYARMMSVLRGPASSAVDGAGRFVLNGQLVSVTAATVFAGLDPAAGLSAGVSVDVHALAGLPGQWTATRIAPATVGGQRKLAGQVQAGPAADGLLQLGGVAVDIGAALRQPVGWTPVAGDGVELYAPVDSGALWRASLVRERTFP